MSYNHVRTLEMAKWHGGVVVRVSDSWSRGRGCV